MWKFGNIEVKGKVVLAPMAGYTSLGYRKYMKSFGASLCYTEMISDLGLIYGSQETFEYLKCDESERPIGIQLFGSTPENMRKAAEIVCKTAANFDFFDINAGCPVAKITKQGSGSSLLKTPDVLADMVRAIKSVSDKPVSVKIRLGWDHEHINFLEVIDKLQDAGVDMIAIHARTTKDLYSGKPNYEVLRNLRSKMKVPLVVSGDIYTLEDAIKALEITGADAVMIARGGVGNPNLIKQVNSYYEFNEVIPDATLDEQKKYCVELAKSLIEEKSETVAMRIYRSIAPRFFSGFANSKQLRNDLAQNMTSLLYLEKTLEGFEG